VRGLGGTFSPVPSQKIGYFISTGWESFYFFMLVFSPLESPARYRSLWVCQGPLRKILTACKRVDLSDEVAVEKRHAARYRVHASVDFGWDGIRGVGNVHDVSTGGAFVVCSNPPPAGTIIDIEVHFPGSSDISPGLTIRSKGKVVRVISNSHTGFAVVAKLDRLVRRGTLRSPAVPGERKPGNH
jgi:hypothetical protein